MKLLINEIDTLNTVEANHQKATTLLAMLLLNKQVAITAIIFYKTEMKNDNRTNDREHQHFGLTEAASRRGSEEASQAARQAENDDVNEENNAGSVNTNNDNWVDNKVATSLDDE